VDQNASSSGFVPTTTSQVVTIVGSAGQCLYLDGKLAGTGKLAKRTKTSNRLGLDFGPGGGNAIVTIDEVKVFGHSLTQAEIRRFF
jgi:hypothetical protein